MTDRKRPPTSRFSDRVADYVRARPSYPPELLDALERFSGRPLAGADVVDVGAGTGIFSALLLERGARVVAVEPNDAMRAAADERLGGRAGYRSVAGSAEATGLPGASADGVVAAQAFHWFDRAAFRREVARVLRPGGWVALVWNRRSVDADDFHRGYEKLLLRHGTDYAEVDHTKLPAEEIAAFLGSAPRTATFRYAQRLDRAALRARVFSSSYTPAEGDPRRDAMLAALDALFEAHASGGAVELVYRSELHFGNGP